MIKQIEEFGLELEMQPFSEIELAADGKVPLCSAKAPQRVPSKVALLTRRWRRKSSRIERLPAGILGSK